MPDAIEWRPSSVAFFARGRAAPVRHAARPAALPAAVAARARPHGRRGARAAAVRRRPRAVRAGHGARLDRAADGARGVGRGLGPAAAREVRRARRRDRDGLAVEQAAPAPLGRGEDVRQERLGYPRDVVGAAVRRARALGRGRRRARADRPRRPRASTRAGTGLRRASPARPAPSARGHDPRGVRRRRRRERTTACSRPCRTTSSSSCSIPALAAEVGEAYLERARGDRVLRGALPAARARPPLQPVLLDQRRRPRAARSSG